MWMAAAGAAVAAVPSGMSLVAQNQYLELYIDEATTEIAVRDRASGEVWYSNPPGSQTAKGQISIRYFAPGAAEGSMDTYNDSAAYGQFQLVPIDGGLRIEYTLGRQYGEFALIPSVLTEERVQELAARIEDEATRAAFLQTIERYYTLVTLKKAETPVTLPASLRVFDGLVLESPGRRLSSNEMQRLLRNILNRMVSERLDLETVNDARPELFAPFVDRMTYVLNDNVPNFQLRQIVALYQRMGYTMDDKAYDNQLSNFDPPDQRLEIFRVVVEYTLDGSDLVVRVPHEEIAYPVDVVDRSGKYGQRNRVISLPIHSIELLEFFGAADQNQTGYILVPDGSGALIRLNNGRSWAGRYVAPVYGQDWAVNAPQEKLTRTRQVHLPVFGMKQGEKAFLAIIEHSAAAARINAAVASGGDSFNRTWATFVIRPQATLDLSDQWTYSPLSGYGRLSRLSVFQSRPNREDIQVRYKFLSGSDADYAGMARLYREYLITKGVLPASLAGAAKSAPLFVELIGSVQKKEPILGIPRLVDLPLTTFAQALEIAKALEQAGVENVVFRYVGWQEGGIRHEYPSRVRLLDELGSRREFEAFRDYVVGRGWELFPDVALMYVYRNSLFDGFSARRDASRTIDRKVARSYTYDLALFGRKDDVIYVHSPAALPSLVARFAAAYRSLGVAGLSLRDMGSALNSDLREDEEKLVDRPEAQRVVQGELARLAGEYALRLLMAGANDYALVHATYLVDIPYSSSGMDLFDEDVPFFPMVIHGLIDYAGSPVNADLDPVQQMLRTIEYGGSLYYQWSYAPSEWVKETDFNHYLSLYYGRWFDEATRLYRRMADELAPIRERLMIGHRRLQPGVYRTDYDGGYSVVVNYGLDGVVVDGHWVGGRDFALIRRSSP